MSDDISLRETLPKLLQVEQHIGQQEEGVAVPVCGMLGHTQAHCCHRQENQQKKGMSEQTLPFQYVKPWEL